MHMQAVRFLSVVSLLVAVVLLVVSVSGAFWPSTPIGDIGMLSTVVIFALFGVVGLALARQHAHAS
jgi:hypothetical protein